MDILKIECEMQVVLDSCISYLKKFKFLKNKLSTDLLADLTVTVDCKKFKLSKLAILNLDENGSVLVTLNHKTNLPKVLVSLKKVLEGFSL
jgi:ribosome recycling factor